MPENLKILRRRIRSVANTKKITRTMEMIASAKLRRVQTALLAALPYAAAIQKIVRNMSADASVGNLPYFDKREGGKTLLVAVASDRGLCGAYNILALRTLEHYIDENGGPDQFEVFAMGRRVRDFAKRQGYKIADSIVGQSGSMTVELSNKIADQLTQRYLNGEVDRILFVFNSYISSIAYEPALESFLPLDPEELLEAPDVPEDEQVEPGSLEYIMEPSPARLIETLMPQFLRLKVYACLFEAATTEHIARRIAMNGATTNCDELVDTLTLQANKARQASITKEILEIVGGAEALKG